MAACEESRLIWAKQIYTGICRPMNFFDGETEDIVRQPATEYTTELLASRPKNLR